MSNGNTVSVIGNVVREPELRFTNQGMASANFSVAVNRRWLNPQSQEWEESASFFDVVCWRELAENVSESLERGSRVIVTGRLEQRTWETAEGEKRSRINIVADEVGLSLRWATGSVVKNERKAGGRDTGSDTKDSASIGYNYEEDPF